MTFFKIALSTAIVVLAMAFNFSNDRVLAVSEIQDAIAILDDSVLNVDGGVAALFDAHANLINFLAEQGNMDEPGKAMDRPIKLLMKAGSGEISLDKRSCCHFVLSVFNCLSKSGNVEEIVVNRREIEDMFLKMVKKYPSTYQFFLLFVDLRCSLCRS
ncbi:hypothetical protein HL658_13330 [Azospirillum sp. RWY-5-1]|uniref:Uncharacterized protein n=1 Tax=Azospirillum oleiclasticum TaxID=2735135 RepID=A0ABX2T9E6_9PROT|nr:hypothetical protein [Azospirillum oleiclasticum]NYZ13536.1 hypothetical protein [Azospirillum oleiclasticum]NYZ20697.1 hypothetical protein [Azospirillum oleiclasticum]